MATDDTSKVETICVSIIVPAIVHADWKRRAQQDRRSLSNWAYLMIETQIKAKDNTATTMEKSQ